MNRIKADKTLVKYNKRLSKEKIANAENKDFDFVIVDDIHWYFQFTVQDGLYKDQKHIVEIKLLFGQDPDIYVYPMHAPMCTFLTPVWHPNISDKGTICLDVLKENWSPVMYTASIITAIKTLLVDPEPLSPQNPIAARMINNQDEYVKKIKDFYVYEKASENIRTLFI